MRRLMLDGRFCQWPNVLLVYCIKPSYIFRCALFLFSLDMRGVHLQERCVEPTADSTRGSEARPGKRSQQFIVPWVVRTKCLNHAVVHLVRRQRGDQGQATCCSGFVRSPRQGTLYPLATQARVFALPGLDLLLDKRTNVGHQRALTAGFHLGSQASKCSCNMLRAR